ncbi:bcl-2-like protein 12 isoform X3 [Oryctolagus cuniculus]|uniref:bcl-2-like protein 12 isoform X3 n=1 Tax=Oryctolagus cuniculus TaxID=9986 RepID=UPI00387A74A9
MAGSEELGLREDTLRVLAAFLRRGEAAEAPSPTPPRNPAPEEPTDFLSRLRRCLPCPLGRAAAPPESPRPSSLPLRPCYGSEPGGHPGRFPRGLELALGLSSSPKALPDWTSRPCLRRGLSKPSSSTQGGGVVAALPVFAKKKEFV